MDGWIDLDRRTDRQIWIGESSVWVHILVRSRLKKASQWVCLLHHFNDSLSQINFLSALTENVPFYHSSSLWLFLTHSIYLLFRDTKESGRSRRLFCTGLPDFTCQLLDYYVGQRWRVKLSCIPGEQFTSHYWIIVPLTFLYNLCNFP